MGFPDGAVAKKLLPMQMMQETWVQSLGREDPLEKEMATLSSILARKIPRTEESGGLQPMVLRRVEHDQTCMRARVHTHIHTHTHTHTRSAIPRIRLWAHRTV